MSFKTQISSRGVLHRGVLRHASRVFKPFDFKFKFLYPLCLLGNDGFHFVHLIVLIAAITGAHTVHAFFNSPFGFESFFKHFQVSVHHHIYLAAHCVARVGHLLGSPLHEKRFIIIEAIMNIPIYYRIWRNKKYKFCFIKFKYISLFKAFPLNVLILTLENTFFLNCKICSKNSGRNFSAAIFSKL